MAEKMHIGEDGLFVCEEKWQHHLGQYEWLTNDALILAEARTMNLLAALIEHYMPYMQRVATDSLIEQLCAIKQAQVEVKTIH